MKLFFAIFLLVLLPGCSGTLPLPAWGDRQGQYGNLKFTFTPTQLEPKPLKK